MANRVKEVSAFDGTSWGAAVPLGANDSNIDITSSTTQPDGNAVSGVTGDSAIALNTSAVAVSEGDTGASAWTKFNRFRKRVANNFANYIQGSIATSYNATGSNSAVYSTNVLNNYMSNVIGYSGTATPSAGTVADQLSSLNDNTPQRINDSFFTIYSGNMAANQSFKLGKAIYISIKLTNVNKSTSTLTLIEINDTTFYPNQETPIMVSTDNYNGIYGWLRTNGSIAINTGASLSNGDVRLITFYIID